MEDVVDVFEKINVLEDYEKRKNRKEIMKLFRKAVTKLNNIKTISLRVQLNINFDDKEIYFTVIVFNSENDNRSFYFYGFNSQNSNINKFDVLLNVIKKDSFEKIVEHSGG